ncbi:Serendipity locus protein alpha [Pseudolycoriella hygida]|uniref:Serendipity locus protein alpha n=1 Tax=Pseudolycoriella hygida TaxID=35572 RepID=A0A9Q0NEN7_9DIPT|nr:Serendipity locus protein alpha [Pseudolycoriella hygida]
MMELDDLVRKCENELSLGFNKVQSSGVTWLNKFCGDLSILYQRLHQFLSLEANKNPNAIETFLLCTTQIVCCIKQLKKAVKTEIERKTVLAATRKFYLDRIMWCLSRLKTINDAATVTTDTNFVNLMDDALELIGPLTLFSSESNAPKRVKYNAEDFIPSAQIRSVVDSIIGEVLTFVNVTLEEDRKPLTCMCQKMLRETMEFEESCTASGRPPDEQNRRLKASTLETTFYQLDRWINDSLLKLVFNVFVELKTDPMQKLKDICDHGSSQTEIDHQVQRIDELFEKIFQIGHFALSFSWDYKTKSTLRSSLASLESLDSYLIPAIISHSNVHSKLLQSHWNEEIAVLRNSIHNIIDTQAFFTCILEIFRNSMDKLRQSFNGNLVDNLLLHCDVLNDHLQTNRVELSLDTEFTKSSHYRNFTLMLKECNAAKVVCAKDETRRIFKRLEILHSVIKKFHRSLEAADQPSSDQVAANVNVPKPLLSSVAKTGTTEALKNGMEKNMGYFASMGITASPTKNLLYESKRAKSNAQRVSKLVVSSTVKVKRNENEASVPFTPTTRRIKKQPSLRVALFKRSAGQEARNSNEIDDTLGLHITDILEQISDIIYSDLV